MDFGMQPMFTPMYDTPMMQQGFGYDMTPAFDNSYGMAPAFDNFVSYGNISIPIPSLIESNAYAMEHAVSDIGFQNQFELNFDNFGEHCFDFNTNPSFDNSYCMSFETQMDSGYGLQNNFETAGMYDFNNYAGYGMQNNFDNFASYGDFSIPIPSLMESNAYAMEHAVSETLFPSFELNLDHLNQSMFESYNVAPSFDNFAIENSFETQFSPLLDHNYLLNNDFSEVNNNFMTIPSILEGYEYAKEHAISDPSFEIPDYLYNFDNGFDQKTLISPLDLNLSTSDYLEQESNPYVFVPFNRGSYDFNEQDNGFVFNNSFIFENHIDNDFHFDNGLNNLGINLLDNNYNGIYDNDFNSINNGFIELPSVLESYQFAKDHAIPDPNYEIPDYLNDINSVFNQRPIIGINDFYQEEPIFNKQFNLKSVPEFEDNSDPYDLISDNHYYMDEYGLSDHHNSLKNIGNNMGIDLNLNLVGSDYFIENIFETFMDSRPEPDFAVNHLKDRLNEVIFGSSELYKGLEKCKQNFDINDQILSNGIHLTPFSKRGVYGTYDPEDFSINIPLYHQELNGIYPVSDKFLGDVVLPHECSHNDSIQYVGLSDEILNVDFGPGLRGNEEEILKHRLGSPIQELMADTNALYSLTGQDRENFISGTSQMLDDMFLNSNIDRIAARANSSPRLFNNLIYQKARSDLVGNTEVSNRLTDVFEKLDLGVNNSGTFEPTCYRGEIVKSLFDDFVNLDSINLLSPQDSRYMFNDFAERFLLLSGFGDNYYDRLKTGIDVFRISELRK